jgi:Icc-related predicted phosphoesterase
VFGGCEQGEIEVTTPNNGPMRIAALADVHCDRTSHVAMQHMFAGIAERADVLLLCGDLTHHGLPEEGAVLAKELAAARIPVLAVLGNHDHQAGRVDELCRVLTDSGVQLLDGDCVEIDGVGFAGAKGFAGGFGAQILEPWGEEMIKRFVHEAVEEALKLESALSRLGTRQRVALLHYAPIKETVEGEPPEIQPFLGCSRLEEPLNRYSVTAAFHGHAHHGVPHGTTSTGVPVYNVTLELMRQVIPQGPPFRILELPRLTTSVA